MTIKTKSAVRKKLEGQHNGNGQLHGPGKCIFLDNLYAHLVRSAQVIESLQSVVDGISKSMKFELLAIHELKIQVESQMGMAQLRKRTRGI